MLKISKLNNLPPILPPKGTKLVVFFCWHLCLGDYAVGVVSIVTPGYAGIWGFVLDEYLSTRNMQMQLKRETL